MTATSNVETLWLFALASKCQTLTQQNIAICLFFIALLWAAMAFLYWSHPGGPAWGHYYYSRWTRPSSLIPGPRGFPLVGSMSLMANLAHHKIAAMSEACGAKRLMAFSLGHTRVIVTCNPDVAREILSSSVFADRPVKESAYSLMFNRAIGFAPYGVYWRTLRRIASNHLFCPKQIKSSEAQRSLIASQMAALFKTKKDDNFPVREVLKRASLNNMMCSVFGRIYSLDSTSDEVEELKKLVDEGYELLGLLNWSDHLPWLADLDPQRIRLKCSKLVPKVNHFVGRIMADRRTQSSEEIRDFVDVLLSLRHPDTLSDPDMIAVLWEMIFRGTDTVAVLIEWILGRLVLHPDVQSRVHNELDKIVGRSRAVLESDISSLIYLTAVVKEVLRLHPPGPLLSWARLAITDTTVDGHHVPKGTTAMINMWSITRDPQVWSDPLEFIPERFLSQGQGQGQGQGEVEFSVMGSDLRLAPFGSGRRVCPGKNLGMATVTFWIASLLHEFEWLPSDQNKVDLSEVLKLSCEMASPLTVKVRPRRILS